MEISIHKSTQLKSIAILMMLFLHLFNNYGFQTGKYEVLIYVGSIPLSFYISLFCDSVVPIFAFVTGYGLYYKYVSDPTNYVSGNRTRLKKLYINYWIILFLFVVVIGLILQKPGYPGSIGKFVTNFIAVDWSYNASWWFFTIYVLFVISSRFWFVLLKKYNSYIFLSILLFIYFISFYFRVYKNEIFDNIVLNHLHQVLSRYFMTLLQFMLGAVALKELWSTKFTILFDRIRHKNLVVSLLVIGLIIFHGFIKNLIIAPMVGVIFIFLFCQIRESELIRKILDFFGPHATNIWLIHMFFYFIFFPKFIHSVRYVIPIYLLLIACSVMSSYFVNYLYRRSLVVLKF